MNGFQLKLLAVILMILDHIGYFFPDTSTIWLRFVGRLSMPIFVFILVQGYLHTKNIKKYISRISIFGTFMFFMNIIISIIGNKLGVSKKLSPLLPNIFITMSLCLLFLFIFNLFKNEMNRGNKFKSIIYISILILILILSSFVEYSLISMGLTLIFYIFRNDKNKMVIAYIVGSIILSFLFSNWIQCFMVFAIMPILLYNNEKGYANIFWKYFFYFFYPIHIYILYLLS